MAIRQNFWISAFLVGAIAASSSVATASTKVAECNKISAIVNKAATEAQSLGKSNNPDKIGTLEKASQSMTKYANQLDAVRINNQRLQSLKSRFVKMYRDTATSSMNLVTAARAQDQPGMSTSLAALQDATRQEKPLVAEFNKYCRGN